jgi:hypothetical protein
MATKGVLAVSADLDSDEAQALKAMVEELNLTRAIGLAAVRRVQGVAWANHDLADAIRVYTEWRKAKGLATELWEVPE